MPFRKNITVTKLMVINSIFKIDLMHKYGDFWQKLFSEDIVVENSDDYCLNV